MPKVARIVVSGSRPSSGPQRRHLEDSAQHRDRQCGHDERQPEVAGRRHHRRAHVGAQHEELTVGEVHDVHDPEDERQARRRRAPGSCR